MQTDHMISFDCARSRRLPTRHHKSCVAGGVPADLPTLHLTFRLACLLNFAVAISRIHRCCRQARHATRILQRSLPGLSDHGRIPSLNKRPAHSLATLNANTTLRRSST